MERSRKKSRRCTVSSRISGFSSNELAMYSWTRLFWNWKAFSCRSHSGQNWFLFCLLWFQALCRQSTIKQATNFAQCLLLILMIITTRSHTWLHPDIFLGLTEIYLVYHSNKIEVHSSWDLFFRPTLNLRFPHEVQLALPGNIYELSTSLWTFGGYDMRRSLKLLLLKSLFQGFRYFTPSNCW